MLNFDPNQVVIYALVFVLGLLVGGFLFTGGGRKWKGKYNAEVDRRKEMEARHVAAEKEWRERESLLNAASRDRTVTSRDPRDTNNDGVVTPAEKPGLMDRVLGRDRDGDGVPDSRDATVDRNRDGYDDRGNITTRVDRDGDGIDDRRER